MKPSFVIGLIALLSTLAISSVSGAENTVKQTAKSVFSDIKSGAKKVGSDIQTGTCKAGIPCTKATIKRNFKNAVKDLKAK